MGYVSSGEDNTGVIDDERRLEDARFKGQVSCIVTVKLKSGQLIIRP